MVDAGLKDYDKRIQVENKLINKVFGTRGSDIRGYGEAVAKRVALAIYGQLNRQYGGKVGDLMTVATAPDDAKIWFGTVPPDLTVIARARGVDWLYTYLRSFYRDDSRHIGTNNLVFPDVGMPNVLWELQGVQEPAITTKKEDDGTEVKVVKLELAEQGTMTPAEFDRAVRDLVNFLDYLGEPAKHERRALGKKVVLFLLLFLVLAYMLKRDYWKDIH